MLITFNSSKPSEINTDGIYKLFLNKKKKKKLSSKEGILVRILSIGNWGDTKQAMKMAERWDNTFVEGEFQCFYLYLAIYLNNCRNKANIKVCIR